MIHSNLRDKILEEAIGILYRDGVERITMRALAGALDYSPANYPIGPPIPPCSSATPS